MNPTTDPSLSAVLWSVFLGWGLPCLSVLGPVTLVTLIVVRWSLGDEKGKAIERFLRFLWQALALLSLLIFVFLVAFPWLWQHTGSPVANPKNATWIFLAGMLVCSALLYEGWVRRSHRKVIIPNGKLAAMRSAASVRSAGSIIQNAGPKAPNSRHLAPGSGAVVDTPITVIPTMADNEHGLNVANVAVVQVRRP